MQRIKDLVPNAASLDSRLESVLENGLGDFIENTKDRRAEIRGNQKFAFIAFAFFVATAIFIMMLALEATPVVFKMAVGLSMIWLFILLFNGRAWLRNSRLMAREVNMALTPIFSGLFDRLFLYTHNGEKKERVEKLLEESVLLSIDGMWVRADDSFEVFAGDDKTEFHELTAGGTGSGKYGSGSEIEMFRGMLMVTTLRSPHNAETYISTDGDREGFAHQGFWKDLLGLNTVKPIQLEWNDFEKMLHVATSDERVAREFLTPEIMADIYDWWQEHKLNMRIAVKKDKLYLLIPEAKIQIESSTTSTKLPAIVKYAKTLARPIWHGLRLADDVVRR